MVALPADLVDWGVSECPIDAGRPAMHSLHTSELQAQLVQAQLRANSKQSINKKFMEPAEGFELQTL